MHMYFIGAEGTDPKDLAHNLNEALFRFAREGGTRTSQYKINAPSICVRGDKLVAVAVIEGP